MKGNSNLEERRLHPRKAFEVPAVLIVGPWYRRRRLSVKIKNLSQTGACLELEPSAVLRFSNRWPIRLSFWSHSAGKRIQLRVSSSVVRVMGKNEMTSLQCAVKFDHALHSR